MSKVKKIVLIIYIAIATIVSIAFTILSIAKSSLPPVIALDSINWVWMNSANDYDKGAMTGYISVYEDMDPQSFMDGVRYREYRYPESADIKFQKNKLYKKVTANNKKNIVKHLYDLDSEIEAYKFLEHPKRCKFRKALLKEGNFYYILDTNKHYNQVILFYYDVHSHTLLMLDIF